MVRLSHKIYNSDAYQFIRWSLPDWRIVTSLYASPIFKTVALIPILGYFALYGDALQDFFAMNTLGDDLFLKTSQRIRLIYFGAVQILFSYVIFLLSCPPMIRESRTLEEYLDKFRLTGSPRDVVSCIFQGATNPGLFGFRNPESKRFITKTNGFISRALQLGEVPESFKEEREKLIGGIKNKVVIAREELDALEEAVASSAMTNPNDPYIIEWGTDICTVFYVENAKAPLFDRAISIGFAAMGSCSILLPAAETFLRVVIQEPS